MVGCVVLVVCTTTTSYFSPLGASANKISMLLIASNLNVKLVAEVYQRRG